jgi:transposase-like protein
MAEIKREIVLRAVLEANGNLSHAARALDVHRNTIGRLCKEWRLDLKAVRLSYKETLKIAAREGKLCTVSKNDEKT